MTIPEIVAINATSESWGNDLDDFYIQIQADIGPKGGKGSETFTFYAVSPKRLQHLLDGKQIRIGRGLLIMNDYDIKLIEATIERLVDTCRKETWDEVAMNISKYAYWEYDG